MRRLFLFLTIILLYEVVPIGAAQTSQVTPQQSSTTTRPPTAVTLMKENCWPSRVKFLREDGLRSNLSLTVSTTLTGRLEQSSGIAMIVPAAELKALLDTPALQADRDRQIQAKQPTK